MKKNNNIIACLLLLLCALSGEAQKKDDSKPTTKATTQQQLYSEIARMDSIFFDAFNNHKIEVVKTIFSKDLEFYHDKGGFANYEQSVANTQSLFERNKTTGLTRTLVKGSLEVYPIKDFGAIQVGEHRFCHVENGKDDCGTFKFTHVWKKQEGQWKLTRVISYDH